MEQNDFIDILRKYRRGEATPEEKKLVDEWYASMGNGVRYQDVPDEPELELLYQSTIYPHVKNSRKSKLKKLARWYSVGIAASILVTVISYHSVINHPDADNSATDKTETSSFWKVLTNTTQTTQVIVLPDNSKVSLEPESKLRFSSVFNRTEREVYLEGEAFFAVTHNADLPFFVHANEVTTKVLGTSFIIKAIAHEQKITVAVKTGKVSVYSKRKKKHGSSSTGEIVLTPNQKIVYDIKEKEISKTLVKNPQVILPEEEIRLMRFEEAPVTEIFEALEKAYGVQIEFDGAIFSSCELTTVISEADDIYSRLDIICDAIGSSYTLQEDRIIISGIGCKAKHIR